MNCYKDFWQLTAEALDFALAVTPGSNLDCRQILLDAYLSLECYSEVPIVLKKLARKRVYDSNTFKWIAKNAFISR